MLADHWQWVPIKQRAATQVLSLLLRNISKNNPAIGLFSAVI